MSRVDGTTRTHEVPQATGDRYVFAVPSDKNPRVCYRVDLTANNGGGVCQCKDFVTRRQPALDRGEPILTQDTACKHIRRAGWAFLQAVLPMLAKEERRPTTKPAVIHATPLKPTARTDTRAPYSGYC
jgi:hypothetical protein